MHVRVPIRVPTPPYYFVFYLPFFSASPSPFKVQCTNLQNPGKKISEYDQCHIPLMLINIILQVFGS